MTQAEKIHDDQFREILGSDLNLCSHAIDLLGSYQLLQRQQLVFWLVSLLILGVLVGLGGLALGLESGWGLLAAVVGVAGICLVFLWRQQMRLGRSLHGVRTRWQQTQLTGCHRHVVQMVTDMAKQVIEYNHMVERLEALQAGDFWRDFRQLSDAEKGFIESTFVQVRGQLLAGLQACRRLIEDPKAKVADTLSQQLVSRDRYLVHEFTAKTMTSNQYLKLAQELSQMEMALQKQLASYR